MGELLRRLETLSHPEISWQIGKHTLTSGEASINQTPKNLGRPVGCKCRTMPLWQHWHKQSLCCTQAAFCSCGDRRCILSSCKSPVESADSTIDHFIKEHQEILMLKNHFLRCHCVAIHFLVWVANLFASYAFRPSLLCFLTFILCITLLLLVLPLYVYTS